MRSKASCESTIRRTYDRQEKGEAAARCRPASWEHGWRHASTPISSQSCRTCRDAARCLPLAVFFAYMTACWAAAPPLEAPSADWDRGAGEGPSCSVTQDGWSGDHVPYFRWSGDQVAVCAEPSRDPGALSACTSIADDEWRTDLRHAWQGRRACRRRVLCAPKCATSRRPMAQATV